MQSKDNRKKPTGLWIMMISVVVFFLFCSTSFAAEEQKVIKIIKSYPELVPGKGTPVGVVNAFIVDLIGEEGDYGGQDHSQVQNHSPLTA